MGVEDVSEFIICPLGLLCPLFLLALRSAFSIISVEAVDSRQARWLSLATRDTVVAPFVTSQIISLLKAWRLSRVVTEQRD